MNIGRRELILPVLAIGLLGMVPAFAAADEDAVAKSVDRKSTRLNSSHSLTSRMPSSA